MPAIVIRPGLDRPDAHRCTRCRHGLAVAPAGFIYCTECDRRYGTCRACGAPTSARDVDYCWACTIEGRATGTEDWTPADDEEPCPDDPEGVHHIGCGCPDVDR